MGKGDEVDPTRALLGYEPMGLEEMVTMKVIVLHGQCGGMWQHENSIYGSAKNHYSMKQYVAAGAG